MYIALSSFTHDQTQQRLFAVFAKQASTPFHSTHHPSRLIRRRDLATVLFISIARSTNTCPPWHELHSWCNRAKPGRRHGLDRLSTTRFAPVFGSEICLTIAKSVSGQPHLHTTNFQKPVQRFSVCSIRRSHANADIWALSTECRCKNGDGRRSRNSHTSYSTGD